MAAGAAWLGKRTVLFWRYWLGALVIHFGIGVLCGGGGTLEDPAGDGPITRVVRRAADDGPMVAAYGLAVVVIGWAVPTVLVLRGLRASKRPRAGVAPLDP